jgi:hypothetical protein
MHYPVSILLWFTPAIAFAVLTGKRLSLDSVRSISRPSAHLRIVRKPVRGKRRLVQWVSFKEFKSLLEQAPELVVFDLRVNACQALFPIAEAFVLPVAPNELMEILVWLPSNRSVGVLRR